MKYLSRWSRRVGLFALALYCAGAAAQWAPTKPIRLLVPYATGGSGDIGLRIISEKLSAAIGQPLVIDNKGGAGGVIGTELGARTLPDGYTWILGSDAPFTIIPHLRKVPYDPLADFEPVGLIASLPLVVVINPSLPVKNMAELVALAKTRKLSLSSNGNGSSAHLTAELIKREAGIDLLHVPYTGIAQAVTDVIGGQVDMTISSVGTVLQHIKSGRLRAIALTMPVKLASLPDVPSLIEAGYNIDVSVWIGLLVPAKTPKEVTQRVSAELTKVLETPEIRERFANLGYVPGGGAPSVLGRRIEGDYAKFGKVIRDANIKE
ncbi:MAG: tripartite tricarboxylate transporter substrate binding protein [Betaproteobacteria bacterium]|nr:tripartite tricarboxylate transporter substrate binding protein [Betaproteobacteria bacterium]